MTASRPRLSFTAFVVGGLVLAGALAFGVGPMASSQPDGLNRVAIDQGFAEQESDHQLAATPTAGYEVTGIGSDRLSTGLAGLIGVAVTFALAAGLTAVIRHRRHQAVASATLTS